MSLDWFSWQLIWKVSLLFAIVWIFAVSIKYAWVRMEIMKERNLYDDDEGEDD